MKGKKRKSSPIELERISKRSVSPSFPASDPAQPQIQATDEGQGRRQKLDTINNSEDRREKYESPVPMTTSNLPRFSRKRGSQARSAFSERRRDTADRQDRRSRSPERSSGFERRRERRSPPARRSPSPIRRSPTPTTDSQPRQRKRPGGASRISAAEKDAIRQRQIEREQAQIQKATQEAKLRGVSDVVRQHYNAVPERGREWRRTDSRIRGLRSFNNWVKSTIIQKFSPNEDFESTQRDENRWIEGKANDPSPGLKVLDIGCGKGGDLGKWQQAPQPVDLYIGVDPADISIQQARERYGQMRGGGGRGGRGGRSSRFHAEFFVKDAFGESLGDIPLIADIGVDRGVGPGGGAASQRWGGGGGFDVVSMMFCMHYAFENEDKARGMLRNVAGSLKKGGRLLGTIPNSEVLSEKVIEYHKKLTQQRASESQDGRKEMEEGEAEEVLEWGNSIYRVRFPGKTPEDGIFRPAFGWKYNYFLEEAVEEVPEYVVPFGVLRGIAEDYNLELQYMRPFSEIWTEECDDPILGPLSERMGVRERGGGPLAVSKEEMDAASTVLYQPLFCTRY